MASDDDAIDVNCGTCVRAMRVQVAGLRGLRTIDGEDCKATERLCARLGGVLTAHC